MPSEVPVVHRWYASNGPDHEPLEARRPVVRQILFACSLGSRGRPSECSLGSRCNYSRFRNKREGVTILPDHKF
eukprot:29412-Pyramimonas_sp.AAC.1